MPTILSGTPIIVLCSRFWSLATTPSTKYCLTTNTAGNGFVGSGFDVINNSQIRAALSTCAVLCSMSQDTASPDTFAVNACYNLHRRFPVKHEHSDLMRRHQGKTVFERVSFFVKGVSRWYQQIYARSLWNYIRTCGLSSDALLVCNYCLCSQPQIMTNETVRQDVDRHSAVCCSPRKIFPARSPRGFIRLLVLYM